MFSDFTSQNKPKNMLQYSFRDKQFFTSSKKGIDTILVSYDL